jgi:DNA-binding protein YbaB
MLDKLRQIKELKKMQDEFSKERIEVEKQGIKVIINGKMDVEEISLNSALSQQDQEKIIKECINEAMNKMKYSLAQKMSQMPGMGF